MVTIESNKELIFLTGFMGSGKSTIGAILANSIGFTHYDLDKGIEQQEGKSINQIFEVIGESYFRQLENDFLINLSKKNKLVVSLGGGTITNPANFLLIRKIGILIYLKVYPEYLTKRLRNKLDRPLLLTPNGSKLDQLQLKERITSLLDEREKTYQQADITIEIRNERIGITIDRIVKALRSRLKIAD
jgi:shikimate kinase